MSSHPDRTEPLQRAAPAPLGAMVRVVDGDTTVRLGVDGVVVGSGPQCDLVLDDRAVSRQHVELSLAPEGVLVQDLGSRNGTFFYGQRLERAVLALGSRLQLGSTSLALEADPASLEEGVAEADHYRGIVGRSDAMRRLFRMLQRLEGSLATVLIEGESGVGKERIAAALHAGSQVAGGPFVPINCGAFPRELIASELFGHRRGAFSGALDDRTGAFRAADGGTLFLDEVGELPLELQPMLLRAIELGEVRPLGDDRPTRVRTRVLAATNRDLSTEVAAGRFRHDLFYRLAVVRLPVPPLRERPDDIPVLAAHFAAELGLGSPLPAGLLDELGARPWPGNVRELRNALVAFGAVGDLPRAPRALSRDGPGDIEAAIDGWLDPQRPFAEQKEALIDLFARRYLTQLLEQTGGNQSEAARIAGLNRSYLGRMLGRHGVDKGGQG